MNLQEYYWFNSKLVLYKLLVTCKAKWRLYGKSCTSKTNMSRYTDARGDAKTALSFLSKLCNNSLFRVISFLYSQCSIYLTFFDSFWL